MLATADVIAINAAVLKTGWENRANQTMSPPKLDSPDWRGWKNRFFAPGSESRVTQPIPEIAAAANEATTAYQAAMLKIDRAGLIEVFKHGNYWRLVPLSGWVGALTGRPFASTKMSSGT